jgi:excisionase family DNA binding protein
MDIPDDLLTTPEAAALVRVHAASIRRWVRTGLMPGYRLRGGHIRVSRAAVLAMVQVQTHEAVPAYQTKREHEAEVAAERELLRRVGAM